MAEAQRDLKYYMTGAGAQQFWASKPDEQAAVIDKFKPGFASHPNRGEMLATLRSRIAAERGTSAIGTALAPPPSEPKEPVTIPRLASKAWEGANTPVGQLVGRPGATVEKVLGMDKPEYQAGIDYAKTQMEWSRDPRAKLAWGVAAVGGSAARNIAQTIDTPLGIALTAAGPVAAGWSKAVAAASPYLTRVTQLSEISPGWLTGAVGRVAKIIQGSGKAAAATANVTEKALTATAAPIGVAMTTSGVQDIRDGKTLEGVEKIIMGAPMMIPGGRALLKKKGKVLEAWRETASPEARATGEFQRGKSRPLGPNEQPVDYPDLPATTPPPVTSQVEPSQPVPGFAAEGGQRAAYAEQFDPVDAARAEMLRSQSKGTGAPPPVTVPDPPRSNFTVRRTFGDLQQGSSVMYMGRQEGAPVFRVLDPRGLPTSQRITLPPTTSAEALRSMLEFSPGPAPAGAATVARRGTRPGYAEQPKAEPPPERVWEAPPVVTPASRQIAEPPLPVPPPIMPPRGLPAPSSDIVAPEILGAERIATKHGVDQQWLQGVSRMDNVGFKGEIDSLQSQIQMAQTRNAEIAGLKQSTRTEIGAQPVDLTPLQSRLKAVAEVAIERSRDPRYTVQPPPVPPITKRAAKAAPASGGEPVRKAPPVDTSRVSAAPLPTEPGVVLGNPQSQETTRVLRSDDQVVWAQLYSKTGKPIGDVVKMTPVEFQSEMAASGMTEVMGKPAAAPPTGTVPKPAATQQGAAPTVGDRLRLSTQDETMEILPAGPGRVRYQAWDKYGRPNGEPDEISLAFFNDMFAPYVTGKLPPVGGASPSAKPSGLKKK